MMYQYNFGFLSEWIEANKDIPKGAIMTALGIKSNNGVNAWIDKKHPMPVISMLRFCNTFQVPLSAFFRDSDAGDNAAVVPGRPTINDQLEPDGGFDSLNTFRNRGEKSILNPLEVTVTPSIVPGLVMQDEQECQEQQESQSDHNKTQCIGNISDTNMQALIKLEREHQEHANRLIAIIAEQQKQIADLTNRLITISGVDVAHGSKHTGIYQTIEPAQRGVAEK